MRPTKLGLFLGALGLAAAAIPFAVAQSSRPDSAGGRYTMQPTDGGFLRLDTATGAITFCKTRSGTWSCEAVADERLALEDELTRLRKENDDLKSTVKKLEEIAGLPSDKELEKGLPPKPGPGLKLPTEEEIDKAMSYVERMLKKFKDKLKEFEAQSGEKKSTPL